MVGVDLEDFGAGGSRLLDLREILQGGGSSNPTVQRRVMGNFPFYLEDTGIFPPQGGPPSGKY